MLNSADFGRRFLDGGRQAGAQVDIVALAMLQAVDAKLLAFRRQRRLVVAGQRQERREIGALGEVFGELETGARRRPVGIDGVVQQPEAVLVAHLLVLAAHIGDFAQVERQPQRIQRRPPQLALGQRPAEHGQRIGLLAGIAGALIGDVGRGRGALQQEGLFAGGGRADLENGAGQPQPVAAVLRRGGGDLPEDLQAGAEIAALEGGVGVGSQRRRRFGDRPGLALDLGFQLDRRIRQIVAFEGLVRRLRRDQAKRQRGAKCCGANQTDHDGAPCADERRVSNRNARKGDGLMAGTGGSGKVAGDIAVTDVATAGQRAVARFCLACGPGMTIGRLGSSIDHQKGSLPIEVFCFLAEQESSSSPMSSQSLHQPSHRKLTISPFATSKNVASPHCSDERKLIGKNRTRRRAIAKF